MTTNPYLLSEPVDERNELGEARSRIAELEQIILEFDDDTYRCPLCDHEEGEPHKSACRVLAIRTARNKTS